MLDRQVSGIRWRVRPMLWAALVLLVTMLCCGPAPAARFEDPRVAVLISGVEAFDAASRLLGPRDRYHFSRIAWLGSTSPWAPYLAKPFTAGLTEDERAQNLAAQKRGDCSEVSSLQGRGFLRLYPFLRPAFERSFLVKSTFDMEVALRHEPGLVRCYAYSTLNDALADLTRRGLTPHPVDVTKFAPLLARSSSVRGPFDDSAQRQWCRSVQALYGLAIRRDSAVAQQDLLSFMSQPTQLILPLTTEYYLLERARHRRLAVDGAEARYAHIRSVLQSRVRKRIERAARVGEAEMARLPGWGCPPGPPETAIGPPPGQRR